MLDPLGGNAHGYYNDVPGNYYRTIMAVSDNSVAPNGERITAYSDAVNHGGRDENNREQILNTMSSMAALSTGFRNRMDLLGYSQMSYSGENNQGGAAIRMIIKYMGVTLPVSDSQFTPEYIYSNSGATGDLMTVNQIQESLENYAPQWNWFPYADPNRDAVMSNIIKWVSYNYMYHGQNKVPIYVPGLVPIKTGNGVPLYNWVAISGLDLDANPWKQGQYINASVGVNGIWLTKPSDPSTQSESQAYFNESVDKQIAQLPVNELGVGDNFLTLDAFYTYFQPIYGYYYAVVDPPTIPSASIYKGRTIVLKMNNKNALFEEIKTNIMPLLCNHEKYASLGNKQLDLKINSVENKSNNTSYTIIQLLSDNLTEMGLIIDNESSEFRELTIPPQPINYLLLDSKQAISLLVKSNKLSKGEANNALGRLIYDKEYCKNLYNPLWEIVAGNKKYYVAQDGNLLDINKNETSTNNQIEYKNTAPKAFPNPFNPTTKIIFAMEEIQLAQIEIYDILGRKVSTLLNETLAAGTHQVNFNGATLPSGTYICLLKIGGKISSIKLQLVK